MIYLLLFLNIVNPLFPRSLSSQVTTSMIQARFRMPFCAWLDPAGTRRESTITFLFSLSIFFSIVVLFQCRCEHLIMTITHVHAPRVPGSDASIAITVLSSERDARLLHHLYQSNRFFFP